METEVKLEHDISKTFIRDLKDYRRYFQPTKEAARQISKYIEKRFSVDTNQANELTKEVLQYKKVKNPIVVYNNKKENGDMEKVSNTLTNYIKETIEDNNIIVPSFTNYTHPSNRKSLHSEFLFKNVKLRSEDKKNLFRFKQLGDTDKANYYNVMQSIRKIRNNSLSGAYGSKGTILGNFSAHYTLTSITRCMSSIGNMTTESVVAGNKYFRNPDVTINYIMAIVTNLNENLISRVVDKFNLHIPTPQECLNMILYSSRWYWQDEYKEQTILELLQTLNEIELVAIMYTNDLWHIKEYNDSFMRELLTELSSKKTGLTNNPLSVLTKGEEDILNLVHLICSEEIKGKEIKYNELVDTPLIDMLASTLVNINKTLDKYFLFFKAFFSTDILPTSIAYIKDMLRDSIVLSDTDSTCGSYDQWVQWYFGDDSYHPEAIAVAGSVMTINSSVMDHFIKVFSTNMNIDKSQYETLKMKNEFYWHVFVATNAGKHYFASVYVKEANVFKEDELERKGVHLIASSIQQELQKISRDMLVEILEAKKQKREIKLLDWVNRVRDIELRLIESAKNGDTSIYKKMPIKSAKSYKQDQYSSPYQYHTWWNTYFGDIYGRVDEPPYIAYKIPLSMSNKTKIQEWLDTIQDLELKQKLKDYFENKKAISFETLRLPSSIIKNIGIPFEFRNVLDTYRIINDNLTPLYMLLESLGYYRKPGLCIYESIGYEGDTNE